jgi:hypothetical protein
MNLYVEKKNHHKKRVGGVAQDVGPEFKLQYQKNQNNKKNLRDKERSLQHKAEHIGTYRLVL